MTEADKISNMRKTLAETKAVLDSIVPMTRTDEIELESQLKMNKQLTELIEDVARIVDDRG